MLEIWKKPVNFLLSVLRLARNEILSSRWNYGMVLNLLSIGSQGLSQDFKGNGAVNSNNFTIILAKSW